MINNNIIVIIIVILCLLISLFLSKKNKEGFNVNPTIISLSDVNLTDDKMDINTLTQTARDLMSDNNIQLKGSFNIRDNLKVVGNATLQGNTNILGNLTVGSFNYLPKGSIVAWNSFIAPSGWAICDGNNGTPNLTGRFVLGAKANKYNIKDTGGKDKVTLKLEEMPSHNHDNNKRVMEDYPAGLYEGGGNGNYVNSDSFFRDVGGNQPHENMPPYIILQYIMKL